MPRISWYLSTNLEILKTNCKWTQKWWNFWNFFSKIRKIRNFKNFRILDNTQNYTFVMCHICHIRASALSQMVPNHIPINIHFADSNFDFNYVLLRCEFSSLNTIFHWKHQYNSINQWFFIFFNKQNFSLHK